VYTDGDIEDLRLEDLEGLARLDPQNNNDDDVDNPASASGISSKRPRLTIKLGGASSSSSSSSRSSSSSPKPKTGGGGGGGGGDDAGSWWFPRTREEYAALLRGAEREADDREARRLASDVLSRSREVDDLVSRLPGMGRTRKEQMDAIAELIRDNQNVGRELGSALETARTRREEVREALAENTCVALGVEDGEDS
jgi:hypothetical protein